MSTETLPKLTKTRMMRLASFLYDLKPSKWDYAVLVAKSSKLPKQKRECGTVCCAAGWLPNVDPANWCWIPTSFSSVYSSSGWGSIALDVSYKKKEIGMRLEAQLAKYFKGMPEHFANVIFGSAGDYIYTDGNGTDRVYRNAQVKEHHVAALLCSVVRNGILPNKGDFPTDKKACRSYVRKCLKEFQA